RWRALDGGVSEGRDCRLEERALRGHDRRRDQRPRPHDSRVGLDEQHRHDARGPAAAPPVATPLPYVLLRPRSGGCFPRTVVCATSQTMLTATGIPLRVAGSNRARDTASRSSSTRASVVSGAPAVASWPSRISRLETVPSRVTVADSVTTA